MANEHQSMFKWGLFWEYVFPAIVALLSAIILAFTGLWQGFGLPATLLLFIAGGLGGAWLGSIAGAFFCIAHGSVHEVRTNGFSMPIVCAILFSAYLLICILINGKPIDAGLIVLAIIFGWIQGMLIGVIGQLLWRGIRKIVVVVQASRRVKSAPQISNAPDLMNREP